MIPQMITIASRLLNTSRSRRLPELWSKSASLRTTGIWSRSVETAAIGVLLFPRSALARCGGFSDRDAARTCQRKSPFANVRDCGQGHRILQCHPRKGQPGIRRSRQSATGVGEDQRALRRPCRADDRCRQAGIDLGPMRATVIAAEHITAESVNHNGILAIGDSKQAAVVLW